LRAPDAQAFFLAADPGYRFCLFHRCSGSPRGAILFVHAFAEEMNKSRRMAAMQSRGLAQLGFDVLQIDLLGCGDSSGEFSDATWRHWLEDVRIGMQALADLSSGVPWLWGHRTGALLASEFAHGLLAPARLLLWHPVTAGRPFLNQFLRMKLLAGGNAGELERMDTRALRAALSNGEAIEVAGYRLPPALFDGLDKAVLHAPPHRSRVVWLDVVHAQDAPPPASSSQMLQVWARRNVAVSHGTVAGAAFWQTQEITDCAALIAHTQEAMSK
jgi:exosortase A-associated hydrolase 2